MRNEEAQGIRNFIDRTSDDLVLPPCFTDGKMRSKESGQLAPGYPVREGGVL